MKAIVKWINPIHNNIAKIIRHTVFKGYEDINHPYGQYSIVYTKLDNERYEMFSLSNDIPKEYLQSGNEFTIYNGPNKVADGYII